MRQGSGSPPTAVRPTSASIPRPSQADHAVEAQLGGDGQPAPKPKPYREDEAHDAPPVTYHKMGIVQKRSEVLARVREPAIACPTCDTQVMPVDMPSHLRERCPGPREPGPGAKWIPQQEVLALGVPRSTLAGWIRRRQVRVAGARPNRRYLMRDIAWKIALRMAFR